MEKWEREIDSLQDNSAPDDRFIGKLIDRFGRDKLPEAIVKCFRHLCQIVGANPQTAPRFEEGAGYLGALHGLLLEEVTMNTTPMDLFEGIAKTAYMLGLYQGEGHKLEELL